MPLPPVYGFTQNLKILQSSASLGGLSQSSFEFVLGMNKRIRNSLLLMNNFGFSQHGIDIGLGVNWLVNQKM